MRCILCSLLVATLPFGSVLADMPKEKNAKVTLVYQHELPNVPGKSRESAAAPAAHLQSAVGAVKGGGEARSAPEHLGAEHDL